MTIKWAEFVGELCDDAGRKGGAHKKTKCPPEMLGRVVQFVEKAGDRHICRCRPIVRHRRKPIPLKEVARTGIIVGQSLNGANWIVLLGKTKRAIPKQQARLA